MPRIRIRRVAVAVSMTLILISCSSSDSAAPTTTSTTTTTTTTTTTAAPTTTTTTTAAPTTTTTSTTTTEPPADCPGDGAIPGGVVDHTIAGGDIDGDGDVDTLHTYAEEGADAASKTWWLQVSFAGGGGTTVSLDYPNIAFADVLTFDGIDINGDGTDEIFAKVGGGDHVRVYDVFVVINCDLTATTSEGGPLEILEGSSPETPGHLWGFECAEFVGGDPLGLWTYDGEEILDDPEWLVATRFWSLSGSIFTFEFGEGVGASDPSGFQGPMCSGVFPFG